MIHQADCSGDDPKPEGDALQERETQAAF